MTARDLLRELLACHLDGCGRHQQRAGMCEAGLDDAESERLRSLGRTGTPSDG